MKRRYALAAALPAIFLISFIFWPRTGDQLKRGINQPLTMIRGNSVSQRDMKAQASIKLAAQDAHITLEEAERQLTSSIVKARENARLAAGGYPPGAHIVSGLTKDILDPRKIKSVPAGGVIDFENIRNMHRQLRSGDPSKDESIYIRPLDIDGSDLRNAKLIGYDTNGTLLKGANYAQTAELKRVEQTPSGRSGWTGLTRAYERVDQIDHVIFQESDNIAAGITVLIPENSVNAKVGKFPATLSRFVDTNGKSMSDLSWLGPDGKTYSLKIEQIDDISIARLMKIANDLMNGR